MSTAVDKTACGFHNEAATIQIQYYQLIFLPCQLFPVNPIQQSNISKFDECVEFIPIFFLPSV